MVPAITLAANTSAFSQATATKIPAASKVNQEAAEFKADKAAPLLKDLADIIKNVAAADDQDIDADKILSILGLNAITSYAYSSEKQGSEFVNLLYLHDDGARQGIFKTFGEKSVEYTLPTMSPAGTDFGFQAKINLGNLEEMLRALMTEAKAPAEDIEEFEAGMKEIVPTMGINTSALLKKINVNINLALDLDPVEKLPTPFGEFDKPKLVARIDSIKWAWPALEQQLQNPKMGLQRVEKDGIIVYNVTDQIKPFLMGYAPLVVMDTKKDQLWFATSQAFLQLAKNSENSLATDKNFLAAMKGLPKTGNMMSYLSKDMAKFMTNLIKSQTEIGTIPNSPEMEQALQQFQAIQTGMISNYTRDESGSHFSSRSVESIEDSLKELEKVMEEVIQEFK